MKTKTTLALVLFLVTTLIVTPKAFPQRPMRPHRPPVFNIEMLADELELTEDQVSQINELRFAAEKNAIATRSKIELAELELKKMMQDEQPDENKIKNKIEEIGKLKTELRWTQVQNHLKIKSLLTPEQQEKLKDLKKKQLMSRMHREGPFQHGRPPSDF